MILLYNLSRDHLPKSLDDSQITPNITLNEKISAPIEEGTVLGTVKYNIDGIEYTADLVASHSVEKTKILIYAAILLIGLFIIFIGYKTLNKKK